MACAAETIETGRESWMATYFQKVFKTVTDKETGEIQQVVYCDCKLLQPDNSPCKSSYVYVPKYGTGNFVRHLRTKHGIEVVKKKLVSGKVFLSFLIFT